MRPFFLLFFLSFSRFTFAFRAQLAQFAEKKVTPTAAAHNLKMAVEAVMTECWIPLEQHATAA